MATRVRVLANRTALQGVVCVVVVMVVVMGRLVVGWWCVCWCGRAKPESGCQPHGYAHAALPCHVIDSPHEAVATEPQTANPQAAYVVQQGG